MWLICKFSLGESGPTFFDETPETGVFKEDECGECNWQYHKLFHFFSEVEELLLKKIIV